MVELGLRERRLGLGKYTRTCIVRNFYGYNTIYCKIARSQGSKPTMFYAKHRPTFWILDCFFLQSASTLSSHCCLCCCQPSTLDLSASSNLAAIRACSLLLFSQIHCMRACFWSLECYTNKDNSSSNDSTAVCTYNCIITRCHACAMKLHCKHT